MARWHPGGTGFCQQVQEILSGIVRITSLKGGVQHGRLGKGTSPNAITRHASTVQDVIDPISSNNIDTRLKLAASRLDKPTS